jgi:hypothetical protein
MKRFRSIEAQAEYAYCSGVADTTAIVAAITGISAVAAGTGTAYVTARQHGETVRSQLEGEREKADAQRREVAVDRLRETYREFLDVERQLRMLVASGRDITPVQYEEWIMSFDRSFNLLALTGTPAAHVGAEQLFQVLDGIDRERIDDDSNAPFAEKLRAAYRNHNEKMLEIRDNLIGTMRNDLSADD